MPKRMKPKICMTASGYLVKDNQVLLVKHKKLGAWLSPGGHIEKHELPYQAAEREFFEETGIKVKAVGYVSQDFMPVPFKCGLHWVCKENYQLRKENKPPLKRWKKGCEKHYDQGYRVEAVNGFTFKQNTEETDGIDWFDIDKVEEIETFDDVKKSINILKQYEKINR